MQAYFDQGMRLLWAFNHDEATRSFAKAVELARRHRPESAQRRFSSLAHTLRMQGRAADAMAAQQEFGAAWQNADVVLTASAF